MRARRKNYWPTLILIGILWGLAALMIYWVEPELVKNFILPGLYLPFFLIFFPASFFTLAIIWGNSRRGLLSALGLNIFLMLRVFNLGNSLNLVLLFGILIAVDRYFN